MPFNRLNHNVLGEIRPRFKLLLNIDKDISLDHLEKGFVYDNSVSGTRSNDLIFLNIPTWERHYWSPEMTVRIDEDEYTGEVIASCLIGPRQTVWALWAFMYTAVLLLTLFGGSFALVKYNQSGFTNWIWTIPIGILLLSTAFVASKIGQAKGRDQMLHLVSFTYHKLLEKGDVTRIDS